MASRDQLEGHLIQLDAEVPEMRRRFPGSGSFLDEFATRAGCITEAVRGEDAAWAFARIDEILEKHGFCDGAEIE